MKEELEKPWVHVQNPARVEKIISALTEGGKDKLQVIADFDNTLTPHTFDGKRIPSCHCILDNSPYLPPDYREKANALRDIYHPIELDTTLKPEEKIPHYLEWGSKGHAMLINCNVTRTIIERTVAESRAMLRTGTEWMFEELAREDIPLLIFSAGVGNIIEEIIKQKSTLSDNIKIVSNYMEFNSEGLATGFVGEFVHMLNKNENAIHSSDYFEKIAHRHHAVLLGDSMGDLQMADGADLEHCLKIAFLNDKVDELLPLFKEHWDIVIVKDQTLDVVNALLKQILLP